MSQKTQINADLLLISALLCARLRNLRPVKIVFLTAFSYLFYRQTAFTPIYE